MAAPSPAAGPLAGRRIAVAGAGAVGSALAQALVRAGAECRLASRDPERARRVARASGARAVKGPEELLRRSELVLLCVAEQGLEERAGELARAAAGAAPRVALHTNGLFEREPLAALEALGWSCGKLHPLLSLPPVPPVPGPGPDGRQAAAAKAPEAPRPPKPTANPFRGAGFAVGGDPEAFLAAEELARALGGRPFELDAGGAALYHAAAALLAGGLAALFDLARSAAASVVVPAEEAERALLALAASVQRNLATRGAAGALSGPLARNAGSLVAAHLEALGAHDPLAAQAYALLGRRALELAQARGSLRPADARRIEELLRAVPRDA